MVKAVGKLGIGPMSPEIVEAVFRCSQKNNAPLMLIASKNQIDWDGGYVNDWTTKSYMDYVGQMKSKYPQAQVLVCRDHCGPGFKKDELKDVYNTIDDDIEQGFDFIHIDFCHYKGLYEDKLKESAKAIEYIRSKKPDILIEVGTDENVGAFLNNLEKIENEMKYFSAYAPITFYVCQTGSLVKEVNQIGGFNHEFISQVRPLANKYGFLLKEHNGDYLPEGDIQKRKGLIDAINVAPQYGVMQTKMTLQKCLTYNIDFSDFVHEAYQTRKWAKWLHKNEPSNKFLCSVIAGHYNFASDSYKKVVDRINKYENFRESVVTEMINNFELYLANF